MRLVVTTPTAVVADVEAVAHVRAEDETGAFGIAPGHADFLTSLPVSVLTWRDASGTESFALVRGGVLSVRGGDLVEVAARGAYRREDLPSLGETAIRELERAAEEENVSQISDTRLHLATMRQIERVLNAGRDGGIGPPSLQPDREPGDD